MPGDWTRIGIKAYGTQTDYWNIYTDTTDPYDTLSSMYYEDGVTASPVTLQLQSGSTVTGQGNVGVEAVNGEFEASIRRSCFYFSSGTQDWDIGGLDNDETYEIRIIASRSGSNTDRIGEMTIGGTMIELDASGDHSSEIGTWTQVSPTSGVITCSYALKTSPASAFAYINGIIIRTDTVAGGGLSIPIASYHYRHHIGSGL